ncbi:MAG TPA: 4-(cytidine 5'-diphospho)-2-C-methyl-D-erythritol kinase [Bryobacteraceae bacterium]|nr:4-(cytidine 5'-diphospho)-2-C-methyl-D-erythritol kinase [Bryobacteraceae bacterium]
MHVTVPSFAKLNLDLRVLDKRADGYHELRTIFQTVSLKDTLTIDFDFAKRTQIDLSSSVDIPDNLVVRSAKLALDALKVRAWVRFVLDKRIPMGAGLGGGSSNAAAVLLALPALANKHISQPDLFRLAESLGSDVPFFLQGGTALGLGRGTELYPLPELPAQPALIVASGIHVSTREAYAALGREGYSASVRDVADPLTSSPESPILREFQTIAWTLDGSGLDRLPLTNDFEKAVFKMHATLPALARKLRRLGARPVRLTGSGSALFGVFNSVEASQAAASEFPPGTAFSVRFVSRRQYRSAWRRALGRLTPGLSLMSGG